MDLYNKIVAVEQNELLITETYEEETDEYFDFINDICISLHELYNEFINVSIKKRDEYIPLPSVLCYIVSLYTEGQVFCPMLEHFEYCARRKKYMDYYNNYIRQTNICQYYIDIARESKVIIREIKLEMYNNKKIIEKSMPLLSTTRLLKEYKNRIVISRHNISHCVISYLDTETMTNRPEVLYSNMREYQYARQYAKKRKVF